MYNFFLVFEASFFGPQIFQEIEKHDVITESTIAEVSRQVLSAIVFFHAKGIVFNNFSPEVILSDAQSDSKFESSNMNIMLINTDLSCA